MKRCPDAGNLFNGLKGLFPAKSFPERLNHQDTPQHIPAIITGDFNTAVGDPSSACGDCFSTNKQIDPAHRHHRPDNRPLRHMFVVEVDG